MSDKVNRKDEEEFFASAVHELRTPLTAIHGYAELLAKGSPSESEVKAFSQIVHRNSAYVLRLVNGLLDLSKLRAGKFELEQKPFNLLTFCQEIEEVSKPRAQEKEVSFGIECMYPLPRQVVGDALRLKQVLLNLTSNAVKFTKKGGVKVVVSLDQSSKNLNFKVVDTGVGLSEEQQERLFSAFSQADITIAQEFGGTGLGLFVSKEILNQMGASLKVTSELGRGSVFEISLPLNHDEPLELLHKHPNDRKTESSARKVPALIGDVLIIEDSADTRVLVRYLLEKTGATVTTAENGDVGLKIALQKTFDLILLDRHLPIMDGPTVAGKLRDSGYTNPIVAFSAEQGRDTRKWIKEAGLSGAIPKPFSRAELYRVVKKHLKTVADVLASDAPVQSSLIEEGEKFRAVIEHFVKGLPLRLEIILCAMNENNLEVVAAEAHKLRSATIFGFPLIAKVSSSLEKAAKQNLRTTVDEHVAELEGLVMRVVSGVND